MEQIDTLSSKTSTDSVFYRPADEFFPQLLPLGLTYDDVSLATRYSEILPSDARLETNLSESLKLRIPIISADMDTVTESAMAIAMALNGGLGLIHYNMPPEEQVKEVARVKNHVHGLIQDPITVRPDEDIGDILAMIENQGYNFHTFPVVGDKGVFVGLLRGRVVKYRYRAKPVHEAMTPHEEVFTIPEKEIGKDPIGTADKFFNEHLGIHKLLVVDERSRLRGLFTLSDIERISEEARSPVKPSRDEHFRLICGAAVSATRTAAGELDADQILEHTAELVDRGVDAVAVSTAHGHSAGVGKVVRLLRDAFKEITLLAGNVTSAEGVDYLAECGADAVKVGQGPGSICTTRIVAGVGIPQLTALYTASQAASRRRVKILADGGITKSGDIVKALTLADAVICGGLLAGCRQAPGKIIEINGKLYKQYRGMGSYEAMKSGSAARYGHSGKESHQKVAAEGVEALKEVSGSVDDILAQLSGGIQSGLGYLGAADLDELKEKARYIRITVAGLREAAPHNIIELKAAKESG